MIAAMSAWIQTLLFILLFAVFLELMLPNGELRRFIRVIIGLFIMLAVLNPLVLLVQSLHSTAAASSFSTASLGRQKNSLNREAIYREQLERQIRAAVLTIAGIREAQVQVELNQPQQAGNTKIQAVTIVLERTNHQAEKAGDEPKTVDQVKALVAGLYQVPPQNIVVK